MEKNIEDFSKFIKGLDKEISNSKDQVREAEMKNRLREVAEKYAGEDRIISSLELVEDIKNRPEERKIMTGIFELDNILKGFRPNQVVVIAAPTKNGKTSFCMDLTSKMKEHSPLWFPFEEGGDELVTKFIERGEEVPEFCLPKRNEQNSLLWIEQKIIEGIVKYNSQIVFIDHLHFIVPFTADRQDLMIGKTMRELKSIAKRWGVTIVLIAHLKKTRLDREPDLEDLRDSSFVAQEADTVIMLWRQAERVKGEVRITNNVKVSVQANRRTGATGNVKLIFKDGHFLKNDWEDIVDGDYDI